jgi:hypothetical protein
VIVGEDALKAAADLEFAIPVILVNAAGPTAAKGRIVRIFDSAAAPPGATAVVASGVAAVIGGAREVSLKGHVGSVVQAAVVALK